MSEGDVPTNVGNTGLKKSSSAKASLNKLGGIQVGNLLCLLLMQRMVVKMQKKQLPENRGPVNSRCCQHT